MARSYGEGENLLVIENIPVVSCPHCGESLPGLHIKCPICDSMSIAIGQKGFSLGKAAAGGILLGPLGLLGGLIGRKKIEIVCQACEYKWVSSPKDFL